MVSPLVGTILMKLTPVGRALKAIGKFLGRSIALPLWLIILAILAAFWWHIGKVKEADNAGYDRAIIQGEKVARQTDVKVITVTKVIREKADANAAAINKSADNERLLGPGKSALRCPATAPTASGPVTPAGTPNDAGNSVPEDNRISDASVVSWGWLVSHAQTCDLDRNEAERWREQYEELKRIWPKPPK